MGALLRVAGAMIGFVLIGQGYARWGEAGVVAVSAVILLGVVAVSLVKWRLEGCPNRDNGECAPVVIAQAGPVIGVHAGHPVPAWIKDRSGRLALYVGPREASPSCCPARMIGDRVVWVHPGLLYAFLRPGERVADAG